jgi:hypothetical protein
MILRTGKLYGTRGSAARSLSTLAHPGRPLADDGHSGWPRLRVEPAGSAARAAVTVTVVVARGRDSAA